MEESRKSTKVNNLYWIFLVIVVVVGLAVSIYLGLQPKTIPKIKLSGVDTAEEFGAAIFRRLRQEIGGAQIVLFGISPEYEEQKWLSRGLVKALRSEQQDFVIVSDFRFGLKEVLEAEEILNPEVSAADVANSLQYVLNKNKRVLMVVPVGNTSHLIHRNLVNLLRTNSAIKNVISISASSFPLNRQEESQMDIVCRNEVADPTGYGNWGCMVLTKARANYYKKFSSKPFVGLMDQVGLSDYLVLFRRK